jgi:hypothetical protein
MSNSAGGPARLRATAKTAVYQSLGLSNCDADSKSGYFSFTITYGTSTSSLSLWSSTWISRIKARWCSGIGFFVMLTKISLILR